MKERGRWVEHHGHVVRHVVAYIVFLKSVEGKVLLVANSDVGIAHLGGGLPLKGLTEIFVHGETHHGSDKNNLQFADDIYQIQPDTSAQLGNVSETAFNLFKILRQVTSSIPK